MNDNRWHCYSRAIESSPVISSGPSSKDTAGPSTRNTAGASTRDTAGPSTAVTTESNLVDTSGPSSANTTGPKNISGATQTEGTYIGTGGHNHGWPAGTVFKDVDGVSRTWVPSGNHSHPITLPSHEHDMYHTHQIPSHVHSMEHTHDMDHTHNIDHTHDMEHTHKIPAHTHDIRYGIYEGPTPTSLKIEVDGNLIPYSETSGMDIDIIPYLSKDSSGRVNRGAFHEIKITPDNLGRILATVVTQLFVTSRGGGNY